MEILEILFGIDVGLFSFKTIIEISHFQFTIRSLGGSEGEKDLEHQVLLMYNYFWRLNGNFV